MPLTARRALALLAGPDGAAWGGRFQDESLFGGACFMVKHAPPLEKDRP
jgi:hypothetical protein